MAVAQTIQGLLLKSVDLISQKKLEKDFFGIVIGPLFVFFPLIYYGLYNL